MSVITIDSAQLRLHATFSVAGATCVVATNVRSVIDSIGQLHPVVHAVSNRTFRLNVFVDPSVSRDASATPHFRGQQQLVFALFSEQEMFTFDLQQRLGFGVVSTETACDPLFWNSTLLPIAMGVLGTVLGVVPLHAACLDRDGTGLMIAGCAGAGKSTLAVALSRCGFSIISDDWTYIAKDADGLTAYGLRATVKLLVDAPFHFPELAALRPHKSMNGEMAYEVNPQEMFAASVRSRSRPSRILFLDRVQNPGCAFVSCDRSAARRFFERNAERLPAEFASVTAQRSRIIDEFTKLGCSLLRTGDSPHETAQAVSRFCKN
jgi:hypothetical protein